MSETYPTSVEYRTELARTATGKNSSFGAETPRDAPLQQQLIMLFLDAHGAASGGIHHMSISRPARARAAISGA